MRQTSEQPSYSTPRRGVKGVLVHCPSTDTWKTRGARLAEALSGRWSHVQGGYVLSETRAAKFAKLYAQGWDAEFIGKQLIAPRQA